MLINGSHEFWNIGHIRIKGHADGSWSLKIYPRPDDLLQPGNAMLSEVTVPSEEILRIQRVAGHLFACSIPPELTGGQPLVPPPSAHERAVALAWGEVL